jgi:hypothetical protein
MKDIDDMTVWELGDIITAATAELQKRVNVASDLIVGVLPDLEAPEILLQCDTCGIVMLEGEMSFDENHRGSCQNCGADGSFFPLNPVQYEEQTE